MSTAKKYDDADSERNIERAKLLSPFLDSNTKPIAPSKVAPPKEHRKAWRVRKDPNGGYIAYRPGSSDKRFDTYSAAEFWADNTNRSEGLI